MFGIIAQVVDPRPFAAVFQEYGFFGMSAVLIGLLWWLLNRWHNRETKFSRELMEMSDTYRRELIEVTERHSGVIDRNTEAARMTASAIGNTNALLATYREDLQRHSETVQSLRDEMLRRPCIAEPHKRPGE